MEKCGFAFFIRAFMHDLNTICSLIVSMPPRRKSVAMVEPVEGVGLKPAKSNRSRIYLVGAVVLAVVSYFVYGSLNRTPSVVTVSPTATPLVSIVMVSHNENIYLERTVDSIMNNTPLEHLLEIVFVDDASDPPASTVLDKMNNPRIRIIRNKERQGLIRSKTEGARSANGELLVFLDAHVRTYPGWLEPMITLTNENYRRIVVPTIPVLDGNTWEQIKDYIGVKLIFDWKMDFIWYVDYDNDFVPIMSGGLLAITKHWFEESGEYDEGMLQWGGENVEQSIKTWLCGGEIVVARSSRVGHVFRETSPYELNITQIHVNKARAVDVWFDDWANYFYRANPFDKERRSSAESLAPRVAVRDRLACKPFSFFVEKFRDVLIKNKLLPTEVFLVRHKPTGLCLELEATGTVIGAECDAELLEQHWIPESWDRLRNGQFVDDCLEADEQGVRVGLCSGHVPEQQHWDLAESGHLIKSPAEGDNDTCLHVDEEGEVSMGDCKKDAREFEKLNVQPYSHELYK